MSEGHGQKVDQILWFDCRTELKKLLFITVPGNISSNYPI